MLQWTGQNSNDSNCERHAKAKWRKVLVHPHSSAAVPVFVRGGAIKVWVLVARDAASSIVGSRLHLHPCVAHHALDCPESQRTVLAAFLLPVMEQSVIQWTQSLGSIRRQEDNVFDGLRAAVTKGLTNGIKVQMNRSTIEHQSQRVSVQSLHSLRE